MKKLVFLTFFIVINQRAMEMPEEPPRKARRLVCLDREQLNQIAKDGQAKDFRLRMLRDDRFLTWKGRKLNPGEAQTLVQDVCRNGNRDLFHLLWDNSFIQDPNLVELAANGHLPLIQFWWGNLKQAISRWILADAYMAAHHEHFGNVSNFFDNHHVPSLIRDFLWKVDYNSPKASSLRERLKGEFPGQDWRWN